MWPTSVIANRTRRRLMPPFSMIRPAQMKNGSVSRMKLPVPSKVFCAAAISGATPLINRNISEPSSIAKLTGKPEQHRQQERRQHDSRAPRRCRNAATAPR